MPGSFCSVLSLLNHAMNLSQSAKQAQGNFPSPRGSWLCLIVPNFRKSWFHNRDYGLTVANSFGQNAFTRGAKSQIRVRQGSQLTLRFEVLFHQTGAGHGIDTVQVYSRFRNSVAP
jgi:hypothetical protein